jgi:TolB-like protein
MKRTTKIIILTLAILASAEPLVAQTKPSLAILPFTGFTERDGEAIALRLENNNDIGKNFGTISRTSITNAILDELRFQRDTGYTDSDTLSKIGKQLAADFVITGHVQQLQDKNIILISIMNVETFQLIAGDYKEFVRDDDMDKLLPTMIHKILVGTKRSTKKLPKLAVPSLAAPPEITRWDSDILAQMLAIEIANSGKYVVLPRTSTINAALAELKNQRSGTTDQDGIKAIGKATNAEYVLAGTLTSLGSTKFIDVKILSVETGITLIGSHEDYESIIESLVIIPDLAAVLTGKMVDKRRFWSFGAEMGTSFTAPWLIVSANVTASFLPYTILELGFDLGFIHGYEGRGDVKYYSLYPFAHIKGFVPLGNYGGLFAGFGAGYMMANYQDEDEDNSFSVLAWDLTGGLYLGKNHHYFKIAYTIRTSSLEMFFAKGEFNAKLTCGYNFRFS